MEQTAQQNEISYMGNRSAFPHLIRGRETPKNSTHRQKVKAAVMKCCYPLYGRSSPGSFKKLLTPPALHEMRGSFQYRLMLSYFIF